MFDGLVEKLGKGLKGLGYSDEKIKDMENKVSQDLKNNPVKFIGIGQAGVGKTELLRSIFAIGSDKLEDLQRLKTSATKSATKDFFSFQIQSKEGFIVEFTDGPGLGESSDLEEKYLQMWCEEIPKHDLLYWVLDGSSRDIGHIQKNMKYILDKTGYRKKVVVVLNKVDQIRLDAAQEAQGMIGWDREYNVPSDELEKLIKLRTDDVIEKLADYVDISREQMVICSARQRWNHDVVLDKLLAFLPPEKRIKASRNRDVKSAADLRPPEDRLNSN
jgi:predicted GTPase